MGHGAMRRPNRLPPYVHAFRDRHGKPRYYFRREGFPRVALPGLPWSPEFMAAHAAVMSGDPVRVEIAAGRTLPGTVNAAVVAYYNSQAWRDFKAGTQGMRRA